LAHRASYPDQVSQVRAKPFGMRDKRILRLILDRVFAAIIASANHLTVSRTEIGGLHPNSLAPDRKESLLTYLA
jgi:hypothetical protein